MATHEGWLSLTHSQRQRHTFARRWQRSQNAPEDSLTAFTQFANLSQKDSPTESHKAKERTKKLLLLLLLFRVVVVC